jgi:ParB family chromosome partitioning protein
VGTLRAFHVERDSLLLKLGALRVNRRLGRGLDSLLGVPPGEPGISPRAATPVEVELDRIRPNPSQPRRTFEPEGLEELRDSIRLHGILQPILVRRVEDGYELIAGERRWRAARMAGLERVPAVVRDEVEDRAMLELALVENVQRRDLDALERARGYRQMIDDLGLTQEQVADRVGLKRATVANHLRLLDLPPEAQEALRQGLVTMGHARALLALQDRGSLLALVQRVAREGLSVRQVEAAVRARLSSSQAARSGAAAPEKQAPWEREIEGRMRAHLGSRVRIRNRPGYKGKIVIDYHDRADLDRLIELLAPRAEI